MPYAEAKGLTQPKLFWTC